MSFGHLHGLEAAEAGQLALAGVGSQLAGGPVREASTPYCDEVKPYSLRSAGQTVRRERARASPPRTIAISPTTRAMKPPTIP
jgi:hypothetical protein